MGRLRLLLFLVAALFLAATFYMAALIAERQTSLKEVSRYNIAWLASQAVAEYTRFQQRAAAFSVAGSDVDKDELELRYDILLSRIGLLQDGEFLEFLRSNKDASSIVQSLGAALADAGPLVRRIDAEGASLELMRVLAPLDRPMATLAAAASRYGAARVSEDQQELLRLHLIFSGLSAGLAIFGLTLIVSLGLQNRSLGRARAELMAQNARFDAAISNIPQGLALLDRNGRPVISNAQFTQIVGADPSITSLAAAIPDFVPLGGGAMGMRLRDPAVSVASTHERSDGTTLLVTQREMAGGGSVLTIEDVTDRVRADRQRKQLEAQLQQAQKMEAVGQLTGGIAHDFNNLLTVILGNAEILVEDPGDEESVQLLAGMILQAAERGADLTHKLLAFGRRQSLTPERLDVAQCVEGIIPLLRRAVSENIEIRTEFAPTKSSALVDRSLLESALLNLVVNARDAMGHGGVLTISTGERLASKSTGAGQEGQRVLFISVADTGTGIPPEVLDRVFEPFFTTKEVGKGSGLGLSMVYGFAEQSGGSVEIDSQVGNGTTVSILLPLVVTGAAIEKEELSVRTMSHPDSRCSGRVLMVEDDPQVLQFVAAQVESLGYSVTSTTTAPEALSLLQSGAKFDVLFSDVVLPGGMNGVELAQLVRERHPATRILLTSGYAEEVFANFGRPETENLILRKPYKKPELAEALRATIEGGAGTPERNPARVQRPALERAC
jgi:signal transduction histidine kinase/ActR/RegA family two-component response regulator